MFPLAQKKLIRGCQEHQQAGLGCAADYQADYESLYMPFDGIIKRTYFGVQGGNWLEIQDQMGIIIQFAHLDKYVKNQGEVVKQNEVIATTGNTGQITTGPHLHIQIFKGAERIDPEQYNWDQNEAVQKVITTDNIFVRSVPTRQDNQPIGSLLQGVSIPVVGIVIGEEVEPGFNLWWQTVDSHYIYGKYTNPQSTSPLSLTPGMIQPISVPVKESHMELENLIMPKVASPEEVRGWYQNWLNREPENDTVLQSRNYVDFLEGAINEWRNKYNQSETINNKLTQIKQIIEQ